MATYYVRKSGGDGNTGLSPAQAWLTIDHAANQVAAGDIVWIGAGVYRETVTIDTDGTNGSEIEWHADIDGVMTGDPGLVYITVMDAEYSGAGALSPLVLNGRTYNEFYNLIFGPGGTAGAQNVVEMKTGNCTYQGILFDTCVFHNSSDATPDPTININYQTPGAIAGNKPTFRNCYIGGTVYVGYLIPAADRACGVVIENCITMGLITLDGPAAGAFGITGYEINNNTFLGGGGASILDQHAAGVVGIAANNVSVAAGTCISLAGDGGTWTLSNNQRLTQGAETGCTPICTTLLGFMVDNIVRSVLGWSPYNPLEPVWDMVGGDFKSGVVDQGSATYAPSTDIYGNPRPMGRVSDDVGAGEARARGQADTGTVHGDTYSMLIAGAGYHDMMVAVDAAQVTISVYGRFDGNYTGAKPILEVLDIPGVADQSDIMTGAANNWEQVSCTFTPTSAGYVRVRLRSQDTSATGETFFDDIEVS